MECLEVDRSPPSLASWSRTARPLTVPSIPLDDLLFGFSVAALLAMSLVTLVAG